MQIGSRRDNLHEMANPVFWESKRDIINLSSAEFAYAVDNILKYFFIYIFRENKTDNSGDSIVCLADDSHEMSTLILFEKIIKTNYRKSSATILLGTVWVKNLFIFIFHIYSSIASAKRSMQINP